MHSLYCTFSFLASFARLVPFFAAGWCWQSWLAPKVGLWHCAREPLRSAASLRQHKMSAAASECAEFVRRARVAALALDR